MSATDARPVPIKGEAYRVYFPLYDADGDLVTNPTGLDSEVSKDGAAFGDCQNEAVQIASSSGVCYLDLIAAEMTADAVAIKVSSTTGGAKPTVVVLYPVEPTDIPVTIRGTGSQLKTVKLVDADKHPIRGARVWLTSDEPGVHLVAGVETTNDAGETKFLVDVGVTYYIWCDSSDADFTNPTPWTVT
jgi:hypothetical protein